ncbi:unnamed protein product [Phaedon cochleariae]|uniref:Vacuolar ATPase assembly integral membrane protein VMA21 homolog n=1 Tax=Phaedon cochleariae TaxID=80249 RepID=A0A9P0DNM4_PHACE|nr:unnamed protein product [Phaedon cochleariae]
MEEPTSYSVFKTILGYSALILVSPILMFFVSKIILMEGIFNAGPIASNVWSAIFAVIILHVAVGLYIYKAYFEADKVKHLVKPDEKED